MDARQTIRDFLGRHCPADLDDEDDIFELGLVNSLFAMQLVLFVEQEFAIQVDGEDLERDNFRSVGAIARLVERRAS
jgi:methoxymalonate biosynthesis acyl carrier protein